jgi:hypothetical protein
MAVTEPMWYDANPESLIFSGSQILICIYTKSGTAIQLILYDTSADAQALALLGSPAILDRL